MQIFCIYILIFFDIRQKPIQTRPFTNHFEYGSPKLWQKLTLDRDSVRKTHATDTPKHREEEGEEEAGEMAADEGQCPREQARLKG